MAELELRRLRKRYAGGADVLHDIELSVHDGEMIVVVGPSGCGKSTLLRMVAGLETISGGELLIDGTCVNGQEPAERDIAMVFQNYALYPHMSVFDNLAYSLKNRGTPKAEIARRVEETARLLDIATLVDRKPRQLSGGQRQRVAMGRAVIREPRVFLFDEPLSNLDASLRVQMRQEIRALQQRLGITSLYVTHDQTEAMTMADRLVVMNAGRIEQIGTPMALFRKPATRFVAGFIGSPAMNFLTFATDDLPDWLTRVPADTTEPLRGELSVGIRPEHIMLTPSDAGHIEARIELVEPLGSESLVHVRPADHEARLVVRHAGTELPTAGQMTGLNVQGPFHLFDHHGQRLTTRPRLADTTCPMES
ncbi:ABC transporter ATP-binding protein [Kushneria indalinina]|uniref:Carbohydrate ABC transporter ATP-binding protein (CUT1 family) n=1 Tax=Kushneria indalinina DSM 14324 TaxID=1122140 RepID=A0A3D9E0N6_9GAMM|nr:sn-glycerol-3-phosphate ABC transporter ATP-binding protein UgpC [Kushneria indalinina]REC96610.1 carbohydrate ABC transporter ATP-binding protein (CUT1 family) [Kushneria indalinina DSM 14324]